MWVVQQRVADDSVDIAGRTWMRLHTGKGKQVGIRKERPMISSGRDQAVDDVDEHAEDTVKNKTNHVSTKQFILNYASPSNGMPLYD